MKFGNWSETLHEDFEQIKRTIFAQRIKPEKIIAINPSSESAEITGTDGAYSVTLNSCTCHDFNSRQLPCKHIYRLAYELNYFDFPKSNRTASKEFKDNIPAEIEHFKKLYFSGAISGEKFNKIANALLSK